MILQDASIKDYIKRGAVKQENMSATHIIGKFERQLPQLDKLDNVIIMNLRH